MKSTNGYGISCLNRDAGNLKFSFCDGNRIQEALTRIKNCAMSASDVQNIKAEIETHEKTLNELSTKWDDDSALKRLSKHEQPTLVRAVVSAKALTNIHIPKLKFKVDLSLKKPSDRRLQENATEEWKAIKPKIESALREFEMLETGKKPEYPTKEQKQRDTEMSKNIEKSLQSKRSETGRIGSKQDVAAASSFRISEDGSGDVGRDSEDTADGVFETRYHGTGDGSGPSTSTLNKDGRDRKLIENVRNFKDSLSKGRQGQRGMFSEIVEDVCPDEAASVKEYIRSLAASESPGIDEVLSQEMLDEIRGLDPQEVDRRKEERNKRLAKSHEIREQRIKNIEKLAEVDPLLTRPSLPSPLPIDGFLDLVETLPGEIQKLVTKETAALADYYKQQIFSKKQPISSRQGKLINMNMLKSELRDQRFDASNFHLRAAESDIAEEHKNRLKEHGVDNAVGRFFGTFSSQLDLDLEESGSPKDDNMGLSTEIFE